MSNNDWVQEGTPATRSGRPNRTTTASPVEQWDDYSAEQAVPVPTPQAPEAADAADVDDIATHPTAPDPEDVAVDNGAPVVEQGEAEPAGDVSPDETHIPEPEQVETDSQAEADAVSDAQPDAPLEADVVEAEEAGPSVYEEPVIAHDLVEEGDPLAVASPEVADQVIPSDEAGLEVTPEPQVDPLDEADAGEIPTPVLADEDGEPAVVADEPLDSDDDATAIRPVDPEAAAFGRPAEAAPDASATAALPIAGAAGAAAVGATAAGATMAGLYRDDSDRTQVIDAATERRTVEQEREAEEQEAARIRAEREAREARLGAVPTSDANAVRDPRPAYRKGVGGFGSFGLFVLRLITAAILGVIGYQILNGGIDATTDYLSRQPIIPEPRLVAWILGFGLAIMALFLVIGLAVRVVGLLLAALSGTALALIRWGQFSIFEANKEGFRGDMDLLLVGVGILLLSLGGGRFGIDGAFARARENAKEAKRS